MYEINRAGPEIDAWGTSLSTLLLGDFIPYISTY